MTTELPIRPLPALADTLRALGTAATAFGADARTRHLLTLMHPVLAPAQAALADPARWDDTDWSEVATRQYYLGLRGALPFHTTYFFTLDDDPAHPTYLARAFSLLCAVRTVHTRIEHNTMPLDSERGRAFDMRQYARGTFSVARHPGEPYDLQVRYPKARHVIVAVGAHFYALDLWHADGTPVPADALAGALAAIAASTTTDHAEPAPGPVTSLPRAIWMRLRAALARDNAATLDTLDRALCVLALDPDGAPAADLQARATYARSGTRANRWFDKSIQLIVCGNGRAFINGEHSALDGSNVTRVISMLYSEACASAPYAPAEPAPFRRLPWTIPPEVQAELREHFVALEAYAAPERRTVRTFSVPTFGAERAAATGLHADTCVQAALQIAAQRVLGAVPGVNEAVNMRHFAHGRYDTILCVTPAMQALVRAFTTDTPRAVRAGTLQAAAHAHRALIKTCKQGYSPVLHWMALLDAQPPDTFWRAEYAALRAGAHRWHDPALETLFNCRITTSDTGIQPGILASGFTDGEPGVLGVAYLVDAHAVVFDVKADEGFVPQVDAYYAAVITALQDLIQATPPATPPPPPPTPPPPPPSPA